MSTLTEVLANLPADRQKKPVMFPACSMAELKYASFLSACAVKGLTVSTREIIIASASGTQARADVLLKPGGVGEPTGLILRSQQLPSLEGVILHTNFTTLCRPIFGYAIYPQVQDQQSETGQLGVRLKYLDIPYPDVEHSFLNTLTSLITACGLSTGDQFYANILNFSNWINKSLWAGERKNWATKRG